MTTFLFLNLVPFDPGPCFYRAWLSNNFDAHAGETRADRINIGNLQRQVAETGALFVAFLVLVIGQFNQSTSIIIRNP